MRDLLLGAGGDLSVSNGQLALTDSFSTHAAQRIAIRLRMFMGEWFLDTNAGTPYFQQILSAPPDMSTLANVFRRVVSQDAYVVSVPTCECSLARAQRALSVRIVAAIAPEGTVVLGLTVQDTGAVHVTANGVPL